jgi:UDP-N-acetylmuramoyl-tripeptide--D-alanyl-D-alanine ligase
MTTGKELLSLFLSTSGVTTDSRNIQPNVMFFALKGENFDGNKFAADSLKAGAAFAVVSDKKYVLDERYILTENTLQALQDLANAYRNSFQIPILGLTGSNGKTTTKELCAAVLAKKFKVHYTKGNFNNHIGVPLTLLAMPPHTEIAVIEMGANKIGDIAELCEIAAPTHGLITNIGRAHIEGFGSFEGVIRGKSELYHYLLQHQGTVFINSRENILENMSKRFSEPVKYGKKGDFFCAEFDSAEPNIHFSLNGKKHTAALTGTHNFNNIITALCIGKYFEVPENEAINAVLKYDPDNQRSQVENLGKTVLLTDTYNANPESMIAALKNLANFKQPKKIAILGDMAELGQESVALHGVVLSSVIEENIGIDALVCFGKFYGQAIREGISEKTPLFYFENEEDMRIFLEKFNFENCAVLLKASRSQAFERYAELVRKSVKV